MNIRRLCILLLSLCTGIYLPAQHSRPFTFDSLFSRYPDAFDSVLAHKADYRLQVLYTRIDRDAHNVPHLTTYSLDADKYYYYCASMMKLPACALALEKLNDLTQYRVSMFDSLGIDSIACTQLSPEAMMLGTPYSCLSQYIKEMLLVSNNNAFNPVYDFLGQRAFQDRLYEVGCPDAVVSNRYANCDTISNRKCSPVSLYDRNTHQLSYMQPCIINERPQFYAGPLSPLVGDAYLAGGAVVNEPKSFRYSNYIPLSQLHRLLTRIILPETQPATERLRLTRNDYQYLYKCMGMFPRECAYPTYDSIHYPDSYMKYFMGLDTTTYTMPANLRIFNKVGQAYGFMTDCSYVVDTLNKVEFFLSCSMYLNADGILNDGKYEYDQIGFPFFRNLFNAVYTEELTRHRDYKPVLHLPDFTDTLLVKPGPPKWLRIDSNASAAQMEAILVSLADSMWEDRKLPINYDNPTSDEVFYRNLEFALHSRKSRGYPFLALQQRNISIVSSDNMQFRIFSWDGQYPANRNATIFQFTDSNSRVTIRKPEDFKGNETQPHLQYSKIYAIDNFPIMIFDHMSGDTTIVVPYYTYLVLGCTSLASGGVEYMQSYDPYWSEDKNRRTNIRVEKQPILSMDGRIYYDIIVEKKKGTEHISYNPRTKVVAIPFIIKKGKNFKTRIRRFTYSGVMFK